MGLGFIQELYVRTKETDSTEGQFKRDYQKRSQKKKSVQGNKFSINNTSHWLWQCHCGKLSKSEPNRMRQDLNTDKSQIKKITGE